MEIEHVSHYHPLQLYEDIDRSMSIRCCEKRYSGPVYGCEPCDYFIHKACADIPQEMMHFSHPHSLLLQWLNSQTQSVCCDACNRACGGLIYVCDGGDEGDECLFTLDIECATWTTKRIEDADDKQIQHPWHVHPLQLLNKTENDEQVDCSMCGQQCLGLTYGCCDFYLHKSCADIKEINYYFDHHPLKLQKSNPYSSYLCKACGKKNDLVFGCLVCRFYWDAKCALIPTITQEGCEDFRHPLHPHPLMIFEKNDKHEDVISCSGCQKPCSDTTYKCENCEFYLHKSCAELPLVIDQPFHPSHRLAITREFNTFVCEACRGTSKNCFAYTCPNMSCKFIIDLSCAALKPNIKFEGHEHLLFLFKRLSQGRKAKCNLCNGLCESNMFRCVQCNYNLHLLCGPLPCTVQHKCVNTIHRLKLMDPFVEELDADEHYCDACEKLRDPDECVYYCKQDNLIVEIKCVITEVLYSLKGACGNVKLRTVYSRIGGLVISETERNETEDIEIESDSELEDIQAKYIYVKLGKNVDQVGGSLTRKELEEMSEIFQAAGFRVPLGRGYYYKDFLHTGGSRFVKENKDNNGNSTSQVLTYSNEAFTQLMENLVSMDGSDAVVLQKCFPTLSEVVGIGELLVAEELAPALTELLSKYDDFTARSKLAPIQKMGFLNVFCTIIREMCNTKVRVVDESLLNEWWRTFQLVQVAGFEIEFAVERLNKITRVYFAMKAKSFLSKVKSRVEELSVGVKELEAQLEAEKMNLEKLTLEVEQHESFIEYERSTLLEECFNDLSQLRWKKAWDGSHLMYR